MTWEIIEGDCLDVMPTLASASVDAIICDLPYGVTSCKWDSVIPFAPMWEQLKRIAKPKAAIVLFGSQPFTSALVMSNPAWFKHQWVWDKSRSVGFLYAKKRPMQRHEDICVFGAGAVTYNPQMILRDTISRGKCYGASETAVIAYNDGIAREYTHRFPDTIARFPPVPNGTRLHPTQKPVPLLAYLIRTYTNEGDTVLDFTCGSGTTGVACVNSGRNFIGIEKEPEYVAVSLKRLADAAQQPALAGVA